jgi:hypothetical protein
VRLTQGNNFYLESERLSMRSLLASLFVFVEANAAASYPDLIAALRFKNSGTVRASERYALKTIRSIYNEGYTYQGQGNRAWTNLGHAAGGTDGLDYLFKISPPASSSEDPPYFHNNTDMPGGEYTILHGLPDHTTCASKCDTDIKCQAWVFDGWSANAGCYLKSKAPKMKQKHGDWAGCSKSFAASHSQFCTSAPPQPTPRAPTPPTPAPAPIGNATTPPSGMRSSVPLGPLGEGSVELRADGRFADWGTIFNNGPYVADQSWARKIELDDAVFGMYTSTVDTKADAPAASALLRTHAPLSSPHLPVVDAITYQGAFPVSRLVPTWNSSSNSSPPHLGMSLTAFSEFEMQSVNSSIAPIVFFAFELDNSRSGDRTNFSLFFNLPNAIGGKFAMAAAGNGITLNKDVNETSAPLDQLQAGNISMSVVSVVGAYSASGTAGAGAGAGATGGGGEDTSSATASASASPSPGVSASVSIRTGNESCRELGGIACKWRQIPTTTCNSRLEQQKQHKDGRQEQ